VYVGYYPTGACAVYLALAWLAVCPLLFSYVAGVVEKSRLTSPMVLVVFGFCILICSDADYV